MTSVINQYDWHFKLTKFGRDIRAIRQELSASQEEIGDMLGLSNKTISGWETGENGAEAPLMANFLRVCNTFDLDPRDYFEIERKQ